MLSHENHDNLHDKYLPSTKMTLNIIKKHDLGKKNNKCTIYIE